MSVRSAKRQRQRAILELVRAESIGSQEALGEALAERGVRVTQSTLSRDLKELKVVRLPDSGGYRYVVAAEPQAVRDPAAITAAEVVAVVSNEVAVILRTRIGRAQGVAVFLDDLAPEGMLATLAGDDTVMVVPESISRVDELARRLAKLFGAGDAEGG